jgi:hypothetical protein
MEKKTCGKRERGKNFTEKEKEIAISIIDRYVLKSNYVLAFAPWNQMVKSNKINHSSNSNLKFLSPLIPYFQHILHLSFLSFT